MNSISSQLDKSYVEKSPSQRAQIRSELMSIQSPIQRQSVVSQTLSRIYSPKMRAEKNKSVDFKEL